MGGGKICIRLVKIVISDGRCVIPGHIHIVITILQLYDIPGMIPTGITGAVITGNSQLLEQILISSGITGTHALPIHQCTVSTLVHIRCQIIGHCRCQCIMHIFLFFIIAVKGRCPGNQILCRRIKSLLCALQIICRTVIF